MGEQGKGGMPGHVRLAVLGKDLGFHSVLKGTSHTTGSQASLGCSVGILSQTNIHPKGIDWLVARRIWRGGAGFRYWGKVLTQYPGAFSLLSHVRSFVLASFLPTCCQQ